MEKKWLTTFLIAGAIFILVIGAFLWSEGYMRFFLGERTPAGVLSLFSHPFLGGSESTMALSDVSSGQDQETIRSMDVEKGGAIATTNASLEEALIREIMSALEIGQYEEVFQKASHYLGFYPQGNFRQLVMQSVATAFYYQKNFSEAFLWCKKAIGEQMSFSDEVGLASLVGFVLKDMERFDPAFLSWMEQVYLRHSQENISALVVGIAYQYLYKNDPKTALAYLQEAKGELALIGRARAYVALQNYPAAIQEYENFFAFYPESSRQVGVKTAFLRQTLYYARQNEVQNPSLALSYYEKLARFPDSGEAEEGFLASLRLFRQMKNYPEAFRVAKKGLSNMRKDRDPEILFEMAGCYYENGQKEEARKTYEEFLSRYNNHPFSSQARGWLELLSKESMLAE
ncbi:MAG: tetratricopeptide repeat protein [Brevinematales bacterium]